MEERLSAVLPRFTSHKKYGSPHVRGFDACCESVGQMETLVLDCLSHRDPRGFNKCKHISLRKESDDEGRDSSSTPRGAFELLLSGGSGCIGGKL
ncbi:hypothetical protein NQZ68_026920 [Dissostichus eleginoides]|nr:hypothetical protein NQZ68_026920 [Dissostichus eleginoides]